MTFRPIYDSLFERVMSKVITLDWQNENGCWIYSGRLDKDGYGRVNVRIDGKHATLRCHTVVWEAITGQKVPPGMTLDHVDCIGKACCCPDHLQVVTRARNSQLRHERKRNARARHPF